MRLEWTENKSEFHLQYLFNPKALGFIWKWMTWSWLWGMFSACIVIYFSWNLFEIILDSLLSHSPSNVNFNVGHNRLNVEMKINIYNCNRNDMNGVMYCIREKLIIHLIDTKCNKFCRCIWCFALCTFPSVYIHYSKYCTHYYMTDTINLNI